MNLYKKALKRDSAYKWDTEASVLRHAPSLLTPRFMMAGRSRARRIC